MGRNKKHNNKYKNLAGKDSKSKKHQNRTSDANIWNTHFSEFQTKMLSYNLHLKDIKGDGNCLFRSIADQLDGNEGEYSKYRKMAVEELIENREFFQNFIPDTMTFDKYISLVSTDGVWGGNMELQALSKVLGVNFVIHMIDRPPMIMSNEHIDPIYDDKGNVRFLHIAYHYGEHIGEHYSSVRNLKDEEGPAEIIKFDLLNILSNQQNTPPNLVDEYESYDNDEENKNDKKYKFGEDEEFKLNEKLEKLEVSPKLKNKKDYPRNKKCYCGSKKSFKNCCMLVPDVEEKKTNEKTNTKEGGKKNPLLILV